MTTKPGVSSWLPGVVAAELRLWREDDRPREGVVDREMALEIPFFN